jgi:uncharacterized protein (DUF1330 family)
MGQADALARFLRRLSPRAILAPSSPGIPRRPMAVYIINNMTIHDRAEYDRYLRAFMGVFRKFEGEILAAVDAPVPVEGEWPYDRTILLRFPSREEARRWADSDEYREIARHRWNATKSNVVFLDEFRLPKP